MLNPEELDDLPELPSGLVSELKNRYGPVPGIPGVVDRAILADAQRHLSQAFPERLKANRKWQFAIVGSSVAAVCMLLFALNRQEPQQPASVARDLDGNRRVDILDAFAIAREIRSGRNQPKFDINSDGHVNQADVNTMAQRAVTL